MRTRDAPFLWNHLNDVVCIYKPLHVSAKAARQILLNKLCADLNKLDCRPQRQYVEISGDTSKEVCVEVRPNYADDPLTIGPRYIPGEMKIFFVNYLTSLMSGVCVVGINQGTKKAFYLKRCNPMSTFRITGQFGIQTNNKAWTGNTLFRCSCNYITKDSIDKAVSAIESIHQKFMFSLLGVHPQSQEAYNLIANGLFRPIDDRTPLIHSIKCIDLKLPYFTLEVVAANEKENHLLNIADEVGIRLKNAAITTSIQCIRCAYFTLEDALLMKHWTLQNVFDNMAHCAKILEKNKDFCEFLRERKNEERKLREENIDDMSEEEEEKEDIPI